MIMNDNRVKNVSNYFLGRQAVQNISYTPNSILQSFIAIAAREPDWMTLIVCHCKQMCLALLYSGQQSVENGSFDKIRNDPRALSHPLVVSN